MRPLREIGTVIVKGKRELYFLKSSITNLIDVMLFLINMLANMTEICDG